MTMNRVRIRVVAVKLDIADLYIKVPSGSNRLFLFPLDVRNVLYCYQSCSLCTSDLMSWLTSGVVCVSVCLCVCVFVC